MYYFRTNKLQYLSKLYLEKYLPLLKIYNLNTLLNPHMVILVINAGHNLMALL